MREGLGCPDLSLGTLEISSSDTPSSPRARQVMSICDTILQPRRDFADGDCPAGWRAK